MEAFNFMRPARIPLLSAPRPSGVNGKPLIKEKRGEGVIGLKEKQMQGYSKSWNELSIGNKSIIQHAAEMTRKA